jgi:hypothetical protein
MIREALISACGTWRYTLLRLWDDQRPVLVVVMVNPSTADGTVDDPTILTLMKRAVRWGFGGILVVNLLALRSSTQEALHKHEDPTGPDNPEWLREALTYASRTTGWVLVAWGNGGGIVLPGSHWSEADIFMDHFAGYEDEDGQPLEFRCLGVTQSGAPKHPLARGKHRVPNDFIPIPYEHLA